MFRQITRFCALMTALALIGNALATPTLDADTTSQWPFNGRTQQETHFSPLTQITESNASRLGLAWEFRDFIVRGRTHRGNEASPLVADGVIYFPGPWSVVYAINARTGKLLWKYDPQVDGNWTRRACCDTVNRGVALWHANLYVATLDGYLISLDRETGKEHWRVDTFTDRINMNYSSTGAPRIAGRNVVIGNAGAEMGARGYVSAYDLESGGLSWRFFTVPGDPSKGPDESPDVTRARATWSPQSRWDLGGGGTPWDSMVYDPGLNLLFVGTGNGMPHPVWSRSPGGGDNLYLSSIVALDAGTGRMRWYYQTTPGESWDYTATQNIILTDLQIGGRRRPVLLQAPKNGFFYVLDRTDGTLLSAKPYTRVTWAREVDLATGRPKFTPAADYSEHSQEVWPSESGGHNWMPMAYDEKRKRVFIPTLNAGMHFKMVPSKDIHFRVGADNEGNETDYVRPTWDAGAVPWSSPNPGPKDPPFQSVLEAWDPQTGKVLWQTEPKPFWAGGVLSTASGLVFQGAADGSFTGYDAGTGRSAVHLETGSVIMGAPVSYQLDGVQYIAVLAGAGGAMGVVGYPAHAAAFKYQNIERLMVFKLDGTSVDPPPLREAPTVQPIPSSVSTDPAVIAEGRELVERCITCHGFRGVPNIYPNLWNLPLNVHAAFQNIVRDGALSYAGMPAFNDALSADDVSAIQAFIVSDEAELRRQKSSSAH